MALSPAMEALPCELRARNCTALFSRTHFDSETGVI